MSVKALIARDVELLLYRSPTAQRAGEISLTHPGVYFNKGRWFSFFPLDTRPNFLIRWSLVRSQHGHQSKQMVISVAVYSGGMGNALAPKGFSALHPPQVG